MGASTKAVPVATDEDRPYWEGAGRGQLVLQRCVNCDLYSAKPRVICPRCHRTDFKWTPVSGRGVIHSYTIIHQTTAPGYRDTGPYVVVHVQIEEEPTCFVTTNLSVAESEFPRLDIGLAVVVEFEDRGSAVLPQFRLA